MKQGRPFIIEKLCPGLAWSQVPGTFLNSPATWREVMTIVARDEQAAARAALHTLGNAIIHVRECDGGECL